jgi:hypothetical protein
MPQEAAHDVAVPSSTSVWANVLLKAWLVNGRSSVNNTARAVILSVSRVGCLDRVMSFRDSSSGWTGTSRSFRPLPTNLSRSLSHSSGPMERLRDPGLVMALEFAEHAGRQVIARFGEALEPIYTDERWRPPPYLQRKHATIVTDPKTGQDRPATKGELARMGMS